MTEAQFEAAKPIIEEIHTTETILSDLNVCGKIQRVEFDMLTVHNEQLDFEKIHQVVTRWYINRMDELQKQLGDI